MNNPIEPTGLVHTPDSMEDFIAIKSSMLSGVCTNPVGSIGLFIINLRC